MSTAASVLVEALRRDEAVNASFSLGELGSAAKSGIGGESGPTLSSDAAHWDDQFVKLLGPEIYRRRLDALTPGEAQVWLREWARTFLRPGSQLTTRWRSGHGRRRAAPLSDHCHGLRGLRR